MKLPSDIKCFELNKEFAIEDHYFHRRLTTAIITFDTKQDNLCFNKTISD